MQLGRSLLHAKRWTEVPSEDGSMQGFRIEGRQTLKGRVRVCGAKNAALPIFAACLLAEGPCTLRNVPALRDVDTMAEVLRCFGCRVASPSEGHWDFDASGVDNQDAPYELVKTMRASFIVLGPLLARWGRARVSLPGGCAIGVREVDFHLRGLERLGARVHLGHGYVEARAEGLHGTSIYLDFPSVGATENLMLAACLAEGETVISNAALEPEVVDLADFLNRMGARVDGAGTGEIVIQGVEAMHGAEHVVMGDRIEAGTFMIGAAITKGDLIVEGVDPHSLEAVCAKLRQVGATVEFLDEGIRVRGEGDLRAVNVTTLPFPGFPTDLQAPMMVLLTQARGTSTVTETIFENRFLHVAELRRMGADIHMHSPATAVVTGPSPLSGAPVMASDLRAGAALVLAAMVAEDSTEISRIYHVDRGYQRLEEKLMPLGGRVERVVL